MDKPATFESIRDLTRAAVEDENGDAWTAAVLVQSRLKDDPGFRDEVAYALCDYAIERLCCEAEAELNPTRYMLPDGTKW